MYIFKERDVPLKIFHIYRFGRAKSVNTLSTEKHKDVYFGRSYYSITGIQGMIWKAVKRINGENQLLLFKKTKKMKYI